MATSVKYNPYENDDHTRLLDNYHYLAERRCLKQRQYHAPLALRRSISLEDSSTDPIPNCSQKPTEQFLSTLPTHNPSLSSSLNSLCLRLRRYQLLPEHDENVAQSSDQNDFNWWMTAARLRPIFEKITMSDYKHVDYFPETYENNEEITFNQCIRQGRRNAVCLGIDKIYYNDQLTLFATIANEVQLEFNLMSSGFKNVK
jgi:hypothetical protein